MDLTASLAVCGLAAIALVALVRHDHVLLAVSAVGAGVLWTTTAVTPPTEAWALAGRVSAAVLLLELGGRLGRVPVGLLRARATVVAVVLAALVALVATPAVGPLPAATVALLGLAILAARQPVRTPWLLAAPLAVAGSVVPLTAALPSHLERFGIPLADLLLLPVLAGVPAGLALGAVLRSRHREDRGLLLGAALILPVTLAALAGATGVATSLAMGAACAVSGSGRELRGLLVPVHDLAVVTALTLLGAIAWLAPAPEAAVLGLGLAALAGWGTPGTAWLPTPVLGAAASVAAWLVGVERVPGGARVASALVVAAIATPLVSRLSSRTSTPARQPAASSHPLA